MPSAEPITWLMPVKNGMPYLPLALDSIVCQSYRNHRIIVWDNGSTDGTVNELRRWIPVRIPGMVVKHRPLLLGASRAALVRAAKTELCALADSDDIHLPMQVETQMLHMLRHPEVVALGTQVKMIDHAGRPIAGGWMCPIEDAEARWRMRWLCSVHQPSVMFRRSAVLRAGNYPDVATAEDFELWIRLCPLGEIYSLPDELLLYRKHDRSITAGIDFSERTRPAPEYVPRDLFPGLTDEQALRLWRVTGQFELSTRERVGVHHLLQHACAARLLARRCGRPDDYFRKTRTYKDQRYWLRRNLLRRLGLAQMADICHRLRSPRRANSQHSQEF